MIGTNYTSGMLAAFAKSLPVRVSMRTAVAVRKHAVSDALQAVFISFYGNATSDDPWLRFCEPA